MIMRRCALSLTAVLAALLSGRAQTTPSPSPAKADYSKEAAVMEQMWTKIAFDNEGNMTREQTTRVRVQTDGGVQQWGLLSLPFQSASQTVEIDYVRVLKADGSTVVTPPDNVQDLDSEITRSAPFYSDLREKHVAVKGLGKGDILEFQARWNATKPLVPGQFWLQYNFQHNSIVLDERLEIKVPGERVVRVKGPQATQKVTVEGGSRIYSWTFAKLETGKEPDSDKKKAEAALGRLPGPDVQISSFQSWEEVGRWYWSLQKERIEPSAAIQAKAAELTKGLIDDTAKMQAIYSFVSMRYRYIGIAFGIGRYQPHAADDVLTNNYGDCKDKHTLLAALLQASGITLYPALISSSRVLDPDIPSPAQFDHVIGYLPQRKEQYNGKDKDGVWLDTTPEVAPFGYLMAQLRDKPALVMSGEKTARLITTPADPPILNTQNFKIEGKLSESGAFEAKVEDAARGDAEIVLRSAFRSTPQSQWKELVQQISYAFGYGGTVSDVNAGALEATTEPFHFSYSYSRKDYPDWSNRQFTVPGLPFYMPPVKDDSVDPVWLGPPLETVSDSKVELPKGYSPRVPSAVNLKYDFAEYHATYSADQGALVAKRLLQIKMREVPASELDDYRSFVKNMQNDIVRYVQASSSTTTFVPISPSAPNASLPTEFPSFLNGVRELPDSTSADANRLEGDARNRIRTGDQPAAAKTFKQAVETDPKFTRAWVELGVVYLTSRQVDAALDAFREAVNSDPKKLVVRKSYAFVLSALRRPDAARDAWSEVLKIAPDDPDANAGLGALLVQQRRYGDAVPYFETAAKTDNSPAAKFRLGSTYLRAGQTKEGMTLLQNLVEADSSPLMLNDVAYEMAEANTWLPQALEYSQRAVEQQEKESATMDLSNLRPEDLACPQKLGAYWDTLGWVHFRMGHWDQAESYLRAAWLLSQSPVSGDHLGQVYESQKKTQEAIHMYNLVLATPAGHGGSWEETRHRLEQLTGAKQPGRTVIFQDTSANELSQLRSLRLKRLVPGSATAEFFLLFEPGASTNEAQFVSGSEKLKAASRVLSESKFQVAFPEGSSARLLRRVLLMCSNVSGCEAVLLTPDSVHSVN